MASGRGSRVTLTGNLDGRACQFEGTLEPPEVISDRSSRVLATLGQPFVLWLFSGLGLTLLAQCVEADRRQAERRVSDVRLVREMLPQLTRTDSEGLAAKRLLAYLGNRAGTDRELVTVVESALLPERDARGVERAAQVESSALALAERAPTVEQGTAAQGGPVLASINPDASSGQETARAFLPEAVLPTRVYLQISDETQRSCATILQRSLRAAGIGAPGIENVGSRAPDSDEIRYFHEVDRPQATRVAQLFARDCGRQARIKRIANLATPATENLIEVWTREPPAAAAGSTIPNSAFCYQERDPAAAEARRYAVHCHLTITVCETARGPNPRRAQTACQAVALNGVEWQPRRGFRGSWYEEAAQPFAAPFPRLTR